jgi:hypothetical protein
MACGADLGGCEAFLWPSSPAIMFGTPKGKLSKLECALTKCEWKQAWPNVRVKLLAQEEETYILAQSEDRIAKERSMRRRRLRAYIDRLADLKARKRPLKRDAMQQAIGAAKKEAGRDARFVKVSVAYHGKREKADRHPELDIGSQRTAHRLEARRPLHPAHQFDGHGSGAAVGTDRREIASR